MDLVPFERVIARARQRLAARAGRADEQSPTDPARAELVHEVDQLMEELNVAHEELRQQNEELESARDALEAERSRYYELFDLAPDAYIVTDHHGVILEANRAASALLRVPSEYLVGKPLTLYVEEGTRREFLSLLDALCGAMSSGERALIISPRRGAPVHVAVTVSVIRAASTAPRALRWLIRDVTDRRRIEDDLRRLMTELRSARQDSRPAKGPPR
ncbi:MAG TPA: PAS domain-containing protein [Gemmatimonadaceae bacterium]|nr:PAS domain-containing protein [Gemmatimonadaceae bacterium]